MIEKQGQDHWEKLKRYLIELQHTQTLLLDMFRCQEITDREYKDMVADSQKSYHKFLRDIHKKPIDESDLLQNDE